MATTTAALNGGGIRPLRMVGNADVKVTFWDFEWDSSYPTGGEACPISGDMTTVIGAVALATLSGHSANWAAGAVPIAIDAYYDPTTQKAIALTGSAGGIREVTNGTSLVNCHTTFIVFGY